MVNMRFISFPLLLLTSASFAQVHPHVNDFIPPGWEIEYSLRADLTGDTVADLALILVERIDEDTYGHRKLIVLKKRKTDYELIGRSNDSALKVAFEWPGAIQKGDTDMINLRSKDGKLILNQDWHAGPTASDKTTFRYDAAHHRMRVIGQDTHVFFGGQEDEDEDTSTNFLTGVSVTTTSKEGGSKGTNRRTKTSRISKKIIWMEDLEETY